MYYLSKNSRAGFATFVIVLAISIAGIAGAFLAYKQYVEKPATPAANDSGSFSDSSPAPVTVRTTTREEATSTAPQVAPSPADTTAATSQTTSKPSITENDLLTIVEADSIAYIETLFGSNWPMVLNRNCSSMSDLEKRDMCYGLIAAVDLEPAYCTKISQKSDVSGCNDEVYQLLVQKNPDPKFCGAMLSTGSQRDCYGEVAKILGDPSICDNQTQLGIDPLICKENAMVLVAVRAKDPKICDGLTWSYSKSTCYGALGPVLRDSAYCTLATQQDPADTWAGSLCLQDLAFVTKETKYCDLINFGNYKEICYEQIRTGQKIQ